MSDSSKGTTSSDLRIGRFDDPDRYWLGQQHGAGAEAELYEASVHNDTVGEQFKVAVKMLRSVDDEVIDAGHTRWLDQKDLLYELPHAAIVRVRDVFVGGPPHYAGEPAGPGRRLYLIMDWVDGPTLADWADRNPSSTVRERLRFVVQLAAAVDYLAEGVRTKRPIVHGDIKPENIIVTPSGPVLVDFGIARGAGAQPPSRAGTPGYRAPEVTKRGQWSPASDRFALGAIAFFLLTGEHPPNPYHLSAMGERLKHVDGLDTERANSILAMLAEDPGDRPGAAVEWAAGLRSSLSSLPITGEHRPLSAMPSRVAPIARPRRARRLVALLATIGLFSAGLMSWLIARADTGKTNLNAASTTTLPLSTTASAAATSESTAARTTAAPPPKTSPQKTVPRTIPPPQRIGLGTLTPVQYGPFDYISTEPVTMDGIDYNKVVRMEMHAFEISSVEYNLRGRYKTFTAMIGFADGTSDAEGYKWHFEVTSISNGNRDILSDELLGNGQTRSIAVPVTGVRRFELSIQISGPGPLDAGPSTDTPVVWANPTLKV